MVELRIDTKRDSHEEIRQAINYLRSVVGDAPSTEQASFDAQETPSSGDDMFSMFEQTTEQETPSDLDTPIEPESNEDAHIEIVEF